MEQYNEEQSRAAAVLSERAFYAMGLMSSLTYMENKFGVVNVHVIEFRKLVKEANLKWALAATDFEKCGGLDIALKLI